MLFFCRQTGNSDRRKVKRMKKVRRVLCLFTALLLLISLTVTGAAVSAADMSVAFRQKVITVPAGSAVTLKPVLNGVKSSDLAWKSSDKNVASVKNGKVTARKNCTAVITASAGKASASVTIKVGKRVSSVTAAKQTVTLKVGDTYSVKATVSPSDAAYKGLSYKVSDKSVLSVKGSTITAKKATVKVTVTGKADKSAAAKTAAPKSSPKGKASANFNTDLTAFDMCDNIKVGFNFGNALDATGGSGLSSETSWGNPKITKKMMDDVKAAGFNAVRIPTSWGRHCDTEGNIDKEWLDRVQEVVDYAYDDGLYIILNSHHDNQYYNIDKMTADPKVKEHNLKMMSNLWTQVANRFKSYGDKLLFETLNEPRTEGSANEWNGGTSAERETLSDLNDAIVKAVRATGGNNAYRFILVPAYGATSSTHILRQTKFPDDDRVIISVHAYSPYNFALNGSGPASFTDSDKAELERFFSDLNSIFISKGRAVIIGETGATYKKNNDDRIAWAKVFFGGARQYGIPCFLWDNNAGLKSGAECFGYYNRSSGKWMHPEVTDAIIEAAQ